MRMAKALLLGDSRSDEPVEKLEEVLEEEEETEEEAEEAKAAAAVDTLWPPFLGVLAGKTRGGMPEALPRGPPKRKRWLW